MMDFLHRYWKWLLAGVAAILAFLVIRRRGAGVTQTVAPAAPSDSSADPSPLVDGIANAIGQQSNMIAAIGESFAAAQAETQETLSHLVTQTTSQAQNIAANNAATAPVASVALKSTAFGPELGFSSLASISPELQTELNKRATDPAFRNSEIARTETVIKNRSAVGLDLSKQFAYYKRLTGQDYR